MIKRKDELTKVVGPIEGGKGEISRELLIEGDELKNKAKVFAGDVVYAIDTEHYIENSGDEDLVFLAVIVNL